MNEKIQSFLNEHNYDIRKTRNARWIDQKCTMDVLSVVADCILEAVTDDKSEFVVADIWKNRYTIDNVQAIFNKPNPESKATNEYDKWFGQPIKLLGYSGILHEESRKGRNYYKINNREILTYIASRDIFAHKFLVAYIVKVLKDSDIYNIFENFFEKQNNTSYNELKNLFSSFLITNTPINGIVECGRIFTKELNPLAFEFKKKGTQMGRISDDVITLDMLMYNRPNWRDLYRKKPKDITREEYESTYYFMEVDHMANYKINKAKKQLKEYNQKYNRGFSEIRNGIEAEELATHMHHIFMKSEFPIIAYYLENLIALTPTQHNNYAHVNGNTSIIDKEYQHLCIISKIANIKENLESDILPKIYDFYDLCYVLNTGFSTDEFESIGYLDFSLLLEKLEFMYK